MKENVNIEVGVQEDTAINVNQPRSKQLGFAWAPISPEIKKSLSRSLTQQKFTDGFLTSLFTKRNENEGARFLQNIIDKDSDLIFIKDREQRFQMVNASIAEVYGCNVSDVVYTVPSTAVYLPSRASVFANFVSLYSKRN